MKTQSRKAHPLDGIVTPDGLKRLRSGHPWLYRDHLGPQFKGPAQAAVLPLGEHWFLWSPASKLAMRRLGPAERMWPNAGTQGVPGSEAPREPILTGEAFDTVFGPALKTQWAATYARKRALLQGERCLRWIFAENDGLPGLVVDAFEDELVAQIQSAPVEAFWPQIRTLLGEAFSEGGGGTARWTELRNSGLRALEGLPLTDGPAAQTREIAWNGFRWLMTPAGPQKTGAYLDQRDNHRRAAAWARDLKLKNAWDLCSFEGGFSLHLAKAGLDVLAVDQSERSLETLRRNAELNGLGVRTEQGDVFHFLKAAERRSVDLISLDPPSFVKSRAELDSAMRGYRELNLRAFHSLRPGGLLVSSACSHHVGRTDYGRMLKEAAHDARRTVRVLEVQGPSPDHGPLLSFPESEYLQAWFLEVV
jgi:23S rRNA (cytosine1962-C5)-methyltransferase